jgi:hypothetical protein
MTIEQAAKLGIHPGMPGPNGTIPIVKLSTLKIQPADAYGCNQSVCITVTGQGRFVQAWDTKAYFANYTETFAIYWLNGKVETTSRSFYAVPGDWAYVDFAPEEYYPNNSQVCNTWFAHSGKPCETIQS